MTHNGYLQGPPEAVHGLAGSREPIREQLASSFGVRKGAPDSAPLLTLNLYQVAKTLRKQASIMLKATAKMDKSSSTASVSSSLAHGSASWSQASAEAGLGGLMVTEVALAAMFDQLKEVPDPIFAVSMHTLTASSICREFVKNFETVEKLLRKC